MLALHERFKLFPYGQYVAPDSRTYFDRRYRPIVRVESSGTRTRCKPTDKIAHTSKEFFYSDNSSPAHSKPTRARLLRMLAEIPELKLEIDARQDAVRHAELRVDTEICETADEVLPRKFVPPL